LASFEFCSLNVLSTKCVLFAKCVLFIEQFIHQFKSFDLMKQQPVVAWAKMAKLDPEQETAFQILTSTFVLDFLRPVQSKRNAWQNWPDRTQQ